MLMPRGPHLPCHFFHLCSFRFSLIQTVVSLPTSRRNSSLSHHEFSIVKWSAKCWSPGARFIFTFLVWSRPAVTYMSIRHVWSFLVSKQSLWLRWSPSRHEPAHSVPCLSSSTAFRDLQPLPGRPRSLRLPPCSAHVKPLFSTSVHHCAADHHLDSARRLPFWPVHTHGHTVVCPLKSLHAFFPASSCRVRQRRA